MKKLVSKVLLLVFVITILMVTNVYADIVAPSNPVETMGETGSIIVVVIITILLLIFFVVTAKNNKEDNETENNESIKETKEDK